jgi:hypothetical protein
MSSEGPKSKACGMRRMGTSRFPAVWNSEDQTPRLSGAELVPNASLEPLWAGPPL